jgi:hypothetical protein
MEQFKTFEQCCTALGYDPEKCLPDVSKMPTQHQEAATAIAKLYIIAEAVNGTWKPDWDDFSQRKWAPWFYLDAPGFRFFASLFDDSCSGSAGGSRLCYVNEEVCDFVATHYIDLWRTAMIVS